MGSNRDGIWMWTDMWIVICVHCSQTRKALVVCEIYRSTATEVDEKICMKNDTGRSRRT